MSSGSKTYLEGNFRSIGIALAHVLARIIPTVINNDLWYKPLFWRVAVPPAPRALGALGAETGGITVVKVAIRVTFWAAVVMTETARIAAIFGTHV